MPESSAPVMVSCILLSYNHSSYIAQAIESVLMQKTDFPYELILADDCSTDGTRDILRAYASAHPDRVRTCFPERNMGGAALSNYIGTTMCRGKYLAVFDGDDYWLDETRLQTLVDFLETHEGYSCVAHVRERRDEEGHLLDYDPQRQLVGRDFTVHQFLKGKRFSVTGALCINHYRIVGDKYHAIEVASRNADDYQRCFIPFDFGKVYVLDRCFYSYRVIVKPGAVNYNSFMKDMDKYFDQVGVLRAMQSFYKDQHSFSGEIRRWQSKHLLLALIKHNRVALKKIWADVDRDRRLLTVVYIPIYAIKRLFKLGERSGWTIA